MKSDTLEYTTKFKRDLEFDRSRSHGQIGIPCIWTTNYDPQFENNRGCDIKWILDNTLFIKIEKKIEIIDGKKREYKNNMSKPDEFDCDILEVEPPSDWEELWKEYRMEKMEQLGNFIIDRWTWIRKYK
jgi:hypothetical protein